MKKHNVLFGAALLLVAGCTSPVIGEWEAKDRVAGERSDLTLDDDDTGKATIYFFIEGDPIKGDFDIEWEDRGDDDYRLEMEADCSGCSPFDFTMDCELNDAGDEMDCEGDGAWSTYVFEWEKND